MAGSSSSSGNRGNKQPAPSTWDERFISQLMSWRQEVVGLLLFVVSVISMLALLNLTEERVDSVLATLRKKKMINADGSII